MATSNTLLTFITGISLIIQSVCNEITCTPSSSCSNIINCVPNETCIVNCIGDWGCGYMKIYCPNNHNCNITAPNQDDHRSMAWAEIYGGYNGTLNLEIHTNEGMELGTVHCPINGDCNLYSKNLLNVTSSAKTMYFDVVINATSSNTLHIVTEGYDEPFYGAYIYCPMLSINSNTRNCVIDVSDGGDGNIRDLLWNIEIFMNEYTDFYLKVDAIICEHCSPELHLYCAGNETNCDLQLLNDTNDEWECVDQSKNAYCPTTDIPTTEITIITTNVLGTDTVKTKETTADVSNTDTSVFVIPFKLLLLSIITAIVLCIVCFIILIVCCCITSKNKKNEHIQMDEAPIEGELEEPGSPNEKNTHDNQSVPNYTADDNNFQSDIIHLDKQMSRSEGVKKTITCAQCASVIVTGRVFVDNGLFYCADCDTDHNYKDIVRESTEYDDMYTYDQECVTKGSTEYDDMYQEYVTELTKGPISINNANGVDSNRSGAVTP